MQNTDLVGCGKMLILNMYDPLTNSQFLNQWNGSIVLDAWHRNTTKAASVTSQWRTQWSALSNQEAAWLVSPSSNNQHDANWIKWEFDEDQILQIIWDKVKFGIYDKSKNICCGIWQLITLGWCYSVVLEAVPLGHLGNTSLELFIVKYHNATCSCCYTHSS